MDSIIPLIDQQLKARDFITNAYDNFIAIGSSDITNQRVDRYLSSLTDLWTKFSNDHDAILMAIAVLPDEERSLILKTHSYFKKQIYLDTETCYLEASKKIKSSLSVEPTVETRADLSIAQPAVASSSLNQSLPYEFPTAHDTHYSKLPLIEIPTFDGDPSKWLNFRDLFASLVINSSKLSLVEKLQYLKTSLSGTAAHLIQNTTLTAENFYKAWESLLAFYDNIRLQVHTALDSLHNLKPMTKESSSELERLYTTVLQIHRTLETLQRPVDKWDDVFVYSTVLKLDSDSVKAWEDKIGSSKIPPSWKELTEFLVTRLFSLQAYERSRGIKTTYKATAKTNYQGQSENDTTSCSICKEKHYIVRCPKYINETTDQKLALVNKHKLCYNCLGKHRVANCKVTKRCRTCDKKHHTTIHRTDNSSNTKNLKSKTPIESKPDVVEAETDTP
ncbi:uncharacterized protein [Temnothorax longispinosus]|uniref:uncharacterized protein n=1 Tax=Temnothorax longispinosus TaxID=300112 RepID=UPI003A995259